VQFIVPRTLHANFTNDTASHSRRIHNPFVPADYIKPCSRNDPKFNECALKSGTAAIPRVVKGNNSRSDTCETNEMHLKSICTLYCSTLFNATCFGPSRPPPGRSKYKRKHVWKSQCICSPESAANACVKHIGNVYVLTVNVDWNLWD
jgi:hypothetical protein